MPVSMKTLRQRTAYEVGQQVKVDITDGVCWERYAYGCAERLNGRTGVVEICKEKSCNSVTGVGPAYLVKFDMPDDYYTSFWFDPCDLIGV